jgi:iron(III) transport system ATP-binding protein
MISVRDLHLTYRASGTVHHALRGISLDLAKGSFLTLLGPSGCGKTTLLRSIAGLETPDGGRILLDGETVFSSAEGIVVPSARRNLGMVFQSYAIWPHMSVFENAAFPLRYRTRLRGPAVRERVMECLSLVKLDHLADRPAPMLSGGQQQRLALARALSAEPKVLLLDEPLSNLDARLREEMRFEIRGIVTRTGVTTIFVTHEQTEALSMSDVVAVMKDGAIVQSGEPRALYLRPDSEFVATFMAHGQLLPGRVVGTAGSDGTVCVSSPVGEVVCTLATPVAPGASVTLVLRPETIELAGTATGSTGGVGRIDGVAFMGDTVEYAVRVGDAVLIAKRPGHSAFRMGEQVRVSVQPGQNVAFAAPAAHLQTAASAVLEIGALTEAIACDPATS